MPAWRPGLGALAALVVCSAAAPCVAAGPPTDGSPPHPAPKASKVWHIHIKGDLDSMRLVRDFSAELAKAEEGGAGMLMLELDGNRWRADVVWGIVQAARGLGVPTAAWLNDPKDGRVGTGEAIVGILAAAKGGECRVAPKLEISLEPGDDLRSQAPDGTDWERVDRELSGAAWTAMKERGADTELGPALLAPGSAGSVWAIEGDGGPMRLTTTRPTGEVAAKAQRVVMVMPGASGTEASAGAKIEISAELAERLRLVRGVARGPVELLSQNGNAALPRVTKEIQSGLAAARKQVEQDAAKIDRAMEQADHAMHDLPRPSEPDYLVRKRKSGKDAIPLLEDAQAVLEQTEKVVVDYPELLKATAPGKTPVGEDPKLVRLTWRTSFQQRRDDLAKLLAKAREYTGQ